MTTDDYAYEDGPPEITWAEVFAGPRRLFGRLIDWLTK